MNVQDQAWIGFSRADVAAAGIGFHGRAEEILPLVQAACTLMAADPALSPNDAVADVLQLYGIFVEKTRKMG